VPKTLISLESEVLLGRTFTTFFIDRVDVGKDGTRAHSNLRAVENITEARLIARAYADEYSCQVEDETLKPAPLRMVQTDAR
jgi:hypothetical protein